MSTFLHNYDGANFMLDSKNNEAHPLIASLSHHPQYKDIAVLCFYPYKYSGMVDLIAHAKVAGVVLGWNDSLMLMPVIQIPALTRCLAGQQVNLTALSVPEVYKVLLDASKEWVISFLNAGLHIVTISLGVNRPGLCYNPETGKALDKAGLLVVDKALLNNYHDDCILIGLHDFLQEKYPNVILCGLVQGPDFLEEGRDYQWNPNDGSHEWGNVWVFHQVSPMPGQILFKIEVQLQGLDCQSD